MLKCFASGGSGGTRGSSVKSVTPTNKRGSPASKSPTRGRSGLTNARMNYYKKLWNSDQIGVRTMISRMQSEGANNTQIKTAIKWK